MTVDDQATRRALDLAYAHVNRRERTVAEVRLHLERKGISAALAQAAVQTLSEQHLLDDERFAAMFVADKRELEQWGSDRIMRGLTGRGIDRELAERTLSAGPTASETCGGELERALELLRRRFPVAPADRRERERALGVLLRKGYEPDLALDALSAHAGSD